MTDDHLTPEDRALCEALGTYDPFREGCVIGFSIAPKAAARIRDLSAQLADHPTAEDYRNRAERAEQALAEMAGWDGLSLAVALTQCQAKLAAAEADADRLAAQVRHGVVCKNRLRLGGKDCTCGAVTALAAHAARKIDG